MIDDVRKTPARRRSSKKTMVDLEFFDDNGDGPFVLANYIQEYLADEVIEAFDQLDGYRRLVKKLGDLVVDAKAGDGTYGNDPVELVGNLRDRLDELAILPAGAQEALNSGDGTYRP